MTLPNNNPPPDQALPIAEAALSPTHLQLIDEAMIRLLVDTFYTRIQVDPTLGPIFNHHVKDWSLHLPKMYDFWSSVVLRTGRYAGRPLEAHQRLPMLTQAHFDHWLKLWKQTVHEIIPSAATPAFITPAQRMATSMASTLLRN